jgi:hypothetical protein
MESEWPIRICVNLRAVDSSKNPLEALFGPPNPHAVDLRQKPASLITSPVAA